MTKINRFSESELKSELNLEENRILEFFLPFLRFGEVLRFIAESQYRSSNDSAAEMNPMGTLNALGSASCLGRNSSQFTTQSIVKAMDNFLSAVNNMKEVVMVPSRLQGVPYHLDHVQPAPAPLSPTAASIAAPAASSIPAPPSPQKSIEAGQNGGAVVPAADFKHFDCYNAYEVLNMVRAELVCGGDDELHVPAGPEFVETTANPDYKRSISTAIRMHLQGLFQSLHQLTELANGLTRKYQDQVDGN